MMSVSVVVPAVNAQAAIADCLKVLQRTADEIIVVDGSSDGTGARVKESFPGAQLVERGLGASIEELRYVGLKKARGDGVALTEAHAVPASNWVEEIRKALERGVKVGGGPVLPRPEADLFGWALYFARYHRFIPPLPEHRFTDFSGLNVFYHRSILERYLDQMEGTFPETFFHRLLLENGEVLTPVPHALVTSLETAPFREFVLNRYHSGRAYASRLMNGAGLAGRLQGAARAVLLLGGLWLRCAITVFRRGSYVVPFLLSSPVLSCYFACWAWGELAAFVRAMLSTRHRGR